MRSSIRPASTSPKCRSFTVATRHSSSPGGRGNVRTVDARELVLGVRFEPVEADRTLGTVVDHHEVVGDGRDVHASGQRYGRLRRTGVGTDHHRPLNRQDVRRSPSVGAACTGRGHSASTAATIAAASSAVGVGRIRGTDTASGTLSRLRGAADGPTVGVVTGCPKEFGNVSVTTGVNMGMRMGMDVGSRMSDGVWPEVSADVRPSPVIVGDQRTSPMVVAPDSAPCDRRDATNRDAQHESHVDVDVDDAVVVEDVDEPTAAIRERARTALLAACEGWRAWRRCTGPDGSRVAHPHPECLAAQYRYELILLENGVPR